MKIIIDGKECECERGEFLLKVAERNGIHIPTLCHHKGLAEQGCCRVCVVEVVERGAGKIVVSCVYPVERECEVHTNSERVRADRAVVLMLLRARAPESAEIAEMCDRYGAMDGSRFAPLDGERCVMCGLCAMACASLGTGAISTVGRGVGKKVSTPYDEPSSACVGCLACARVCPTDAIKSSDDGRRRTIWGRDFEVVRCRSCGAPIGTREELALAAERSGEEDRGLCSECRRREMTDVMAGAFGIRG